MATTCGTYQQPSQQKRKKKTTKNHFKHNSHNEKEWPYACKSSNIQHSAHHMCLFRNGKDDTILPGNLENKINVLTICFLSHLIPHVQNPKNTAVKSFQLHVFLEVGFRSVYVQCVSACFFFFV